MIMRNLAKTAYFFKTKNRPNVCAQPIGVSVFTLMELLVVIAIITILVGLLLPTLTKVLKNVRATKCINKGCQLYLALRMYADNYRGLTPNTYDGTADSPYWAERLEYHGYMSQAGGGGSQAVGVSGGWGPEYRVKLTSA